jgi:hypothetical protein
VVPPGEEVSYGFTGGTGLGSSVLCSWLRTSTVVPLFGPLKAAMPSKSPGTGAPLESLEPSSEMIR